MTDTSIYREIASRTGGDIYIGVVGAVRTGKSTFIRRFMELLVLPAITDEYDRQRVTDELPQSGSGRTVMTTQPSFVPNEAVVIPMESGISPRIRMVDCVGYMIEGALGQSEGDIPRMVHTPWSDEEMPFEQAAEIGTTKVMTEHSTIGILVTCDGSIADIPRSAYVEAEERVAQRLKEQNRPFVIILNSTNPKSDDCEILRASLEAKYGVNTVALDVMNMESRDCYDLIENILMEFPIRTISIEVPAWLRALGGEHRLCATVREALEKSLDGVSGMKDYSLLLDGMSSIEHFNPLLLKDIDCGTGNITYTLQPEETLFYEVLSEECGFKIEDDYHLIATLRDFVVAKEAYDRLSGALEEAERTGYGLVPPCMEEMTLEKPEIVKQGNRYGVKLKANAAGLHLIKVNVDSEISPLVGSEEQSAELVDYLLDTIRNTPETIWQTNIFGKSLYDLVCNGMMGKINSLPDDVRLKLREAVQRIVNEGCNNLICLML